MYDREAKQMYKFRTNASNTYMTSTDIQLHNGSAMNWDSQLK